MLLSRPKIASLALQVFSRPLHPELFEICRTQVVERKLFRASLQITREGHIVTFQSKNGTIAEVVSSANQMVPQRRRLIANCISERCVESASHPLGIEYRTEFEREHVGPEMFQMVQSILLKKDRKEALIQTFDSSGRCMSGALSYIYFETRARQLTVQVIHTFPDDMAVVKVMSTFVAPA